MCVCSYSKPAMPAKKQIKTKHRKTVQQTKPQQNCVFNNKLEFHFPPFLTPCLIPFLFHHLLPFPFRRLPPHSASFPSLSCHFSYRFASLPVENLTLQHLSPPAEKYWSMMAYNNVKLCNVLFAQELAQVSHDPLLGEISLPLFLLHSVHSPFSSAGNIVAYRSARCILATWSPRSCRVTIGSIACSLL